MWHSPVPSRFLAGVLGLAEVEQTSLPGPAGWSPAGSAWHGPGPRPCPRLLPCPHFSTSPGRSETQAALQGLRGQCGGTGACSPGEQTSVSPSVRWAQLELPLGSTEVWSARGPGRALKGFGGWGMGEGPRMSRGEGQERGDPLRRAAGALCTAPGPHVSVLVVGGTEPHVCGREEAGPGLFSPVLVPSSVGGSRPPKSSLLHLRILEKVSVLRRKGQEFLHPAWALLGPCRPQSCYLNNGHPQL